MDETQLNFINSQVSTLQWAFNVVLLVVGGLGGIILKNLTSAVRQTQHTCQTLVDADKVLADKVQSLEILVAGQYVTRQSHERLEEGIFKRLDVIADKMDAMPCRNPKT